MEGDKIQNTVMSSPEVGLEDNPRARVGNVVIADGLVAPVDSQGIVVGTDLDVDAESAVIAAGA